MVQAKENVSVSCLSWALACHSSLLLDVFSRRITALNICPCFLFLNNIYCC